MQNTVLIHFVKIHAFISDFLADAKDKDAKGKGGKEGTAEKNKDAHKDQKESKVGKTKDAKESDEGKKKSGKKGGLPLPLKRAGDGEAAKNGEGQAKGKNKKEKQEDFKQAKKTKGDPEPVKDTTQENINRLFGLAVAALLTASA